MSPELIVNLILALVILAVFAYAVKRWLLPMIGAHLAGSGGWKQLADSFSTTRAATPDALTGQTLQVGHTLYKRCVIFAPADDGLYLRLHGVGAVFRKEALLIPWNEIKAVREVKLFWQPAWLLSIGAPEKSTVTLPQELFARLNHKLADRAGPAQDSHTRRS